MKKLYYDTEELKELLEMLNPIEDWYFFTDGEDRIFLYLFCGLMSIGITLLFWLFIPILLLFPIKFTNRAERR